MTRRNDIDEYVNLIKLESFESVKSEMFIFSSIKNEVTSSKNSIEDERRDLLMMRDDFKETVRTYREKFEAFKALNLHILITVDRSNLIYLMNEDTVFRKLSVLKKRLVLTNHIREMKIIRRYRDLQNFLKHQQLNRWLIEWEQMYVETTRLKLPDIQKRRALFDFLNALRTVDVTFVIDREVILEDKIHRNENSHTLKDLLKNFRNHLRTARVLLSLMTNESSHSAFATLQSHSPDCDHSHDDKFNLKCLCEEDHLYRNCFYILIKNRPSEWKSDPKIEALVIEKIAKSELIRKKIYMTQKIVDEDTTDLEFKNFNSNFAKSENFSSAGINIANSMSVDIVAVSASFKDAVPAAFASIFSGKSYPYKLQNCWTLNCDTDIHVCNDRRQFNLTRVAGLDDMIMTDKIIYAIESYDTVNILTQEPSEQAMPIKLLNVTLAPEFLTNLVCLSKFTDKRVHWNIENNRLHRNESTFCHTQPVGGHWVLEKNPADQNQANTTKLDKRSFQAFAAIIITESMSSKQEKLAPNHQNAADFQTSMKTPQHLITKLATKLIPELIVKLIPELAVEIIPELAVELTSKLTPELNTELATALNHEMNPEIETSEPYEIAANDDHSSSFATTVLKLGGYVEWLKPTIGKKRLIMSYAST